MKPSLYGGLGLGGEEVRDSAREGAESEDKRVRLSLDRGSSVRSVHPDPFFFLSGRRKSGNPELEQQSIDRRLTAVDKFKGKAVGTQHLRCGA
jgi:hypothetical protein